MIGHREAASRQKLS